MKMPEFTETELAEFFVALAKESVHRKEDWSVAVGKVQDAYHSREHDLHYYAIQVDAKQRAESRHDQMAAIERLMPVRVEMYFTFLLGQVEDRIKQVRHLEDRGNQK
jgi:hypothetical protein